MYTSYFFIEYYQSHPYLATKQSRLAFTGELSSVGYVVFIRRARGRSRAVMTSEEELLTVPCVDRQRCCFYLVEHGVAMLILSFLFYFEQI